MRSPRPQSTFDVGGNQYQLSACTGWHGEVRRSDHLDDLLHRAELAMRHAKRSDADISLFDDALAAHTRRGVELTEELNGAIDRGEISVKYQPVVSLHTGRVSEFEALMRWNNRRFGGITPGEFIPIAEDSGTIIRLGDFVLEAACRQVAVWRQNRSAVQGPPVRVAVNASARQMCDLAFPDRVGRLLAEVSLPADALTLEITETAVMDDLDASVKVLPSCAGLVWSGSTTGTSYSSMTHLRRMPVNVEDRLQLSPASEGPEHGDRRIDHQSRSQLRVGSSPKVSRRSRSSAARAAQLRRRPGLSVEQGGHPARLESCSRHLLHPATEARRRPGE